MRTLISTQDFINSGLPVSDDIRPEEIDASIKTTELVYLKPFLSSELYNALLSPQYENVELKNIVKFADCHCVFAMMLYDRMRLTRYNTVIKEDEHSKEPSEADILNVCSMHWEQGLQMIIDVLIENNLEPSDEITPGPPFAELAFAYYNKSKYN